MSSNEHTLNGYICKPQPGAIINNHDKTMTYSDVETSLQDIEKHVLSDGSDDEYSTTSSRYSFHSDARILSAGHYHLHESDLTDSVSQQKRQHQRLSYPRLRLSRAHGLLCHCTPRRCSRYFSLTLGSIVLMVFFILIKLSWDSSNNVRLGLHKPKSGPQPWQNFPFLKRYHGGIYTLITKEQNVPEYPPSISKSPHIDKPLSTKLPTSAPIDLFDTDEGMTECFLDIERKIRVPDVRIFKGVVDGFPDSVMGSHELIGMKNDICYDRFGRLGPYGLGYEKLKGGSGAGMEGERAGAETVWARTGPVDFTKVKWRNAQDECLKLNQNRFVNVSSITDHDHLFNDILQRDGEMQVTEPGVAKQHSRQAVIIRTWTGYEYDDEDLLYLRALMWELSLMTGVEYKVDFLIEVKDDKLPIWADDEVYTKTLQAALPPEFDGMGMLWSQQQMMTIYNQLPDNRFRDLPLHSAYRSLHMPLAWYAHHHPEFEHIWQFEMDMRYTGHYRHLVKQVEQWAAKQPRKGLWERNARFYIPSEHGTWEDFSHMVRVQTEHGTATRSNLFAGLVDHSAIPDHVKNEMTTKAEKAVWGPEPPLFDVHDNSTDVYPPVSMAEDSGDWGVGEDADLIVFNPLYDPQDTHWLLSEDITGYNTTQGLPPRRAAISSFGRYSHRLLVQIHNDMALGGKNMFSEMFPASTALHHGYKAVYVPHPVYVDRAWPTDYLAAMFNRGRNGQSGGSRLSVFSVENEHNFRGVSWYYNSGFASNLWKRWLGYKVDNDGGEMHELNGEGRICLPPMLIHPVKQVDLVYQENGAEEDGA